MLHNTRVTRFSGWKSVTPQSPSSYFSWAESLRVVFIISHCHFLTFLDFEHERVLLFNLCWRCCACLRPESSACCMVDIHMTLLLRSKTWFYFQKMAKAGSFFVVVVCSDP